MNITCPANLNGSYVTWDTPTLSSCCDNCTSETDSIAGFMYMGYFNGSKYYCSTHANTWPGANTTSIAAGGHLAKIDNQSENAFLANILTLQRAWIGLSDAAVEGQFKWTDDTAPNYTNWYAAQPNNKNNYQDYVSMLSDGQWNDEYNNITLEYIMEVPCYNVTQISGPTSGSWLPAGTTSITYVGEDGCGAKDTCTFDINIEADETCASYGVDAWYMWIENFGLGNFSNPSWNDDGYADFTNDECIEVTAGGSYPITLDPGFNTGSYTVYWKVWIDYNQDGDYFDSNEYVAYGTGNNTLNGTLPIVSNCLSGQTTLRVAMKYGSYPSGPCAVFQYGEVEDYCINISNSAKPVNSTGERYNQATKLQQETVDSKNSNVIIDLVKEERFDVYPNPVNSRLNIISKSNDVQHLTIVDRLGKVVAKHDIDFENGRSSIDVSNLKDGIYILLSEDKKVQQKIIVQH